MDIKVFPNSETNHPPASVATYSWKIQEELAFGEAPLQLDNRRIINTDRRVTAIAVGPDSLLDQFYVYPDANEAVGQDKILVSTKSPWRGVIESGRFSIRPAIAMTTGLGNSRLGARLQFIIYYDNAEPPEIPTARAPQRTQFGQLGATGATQTISMVVTGREWVTFAYEMTTDATVGNRTVAATGYRFLGKTGEFDTANGFVVSETIFSNVTPASTLVDFIQRFANEWDMVQLTYSTAAGLATIHEGIFAEDD